MSASPVPPGAPRAERVRVMVDVEMHAEANLGSRFYRGYRTNEERAQLMERRAEEFNDFIRDHRSQDDIRLIVERKYEWQCSACHGEWDTDTDAEGTFCASCGAPVATDAALAPTGEPGNE